MSNFSQAANFEGQIPRSDPDNPTMLLIDHQSGLFQTVKDMPKTELRATWNRPDAAQWAEAYSAVFPHYQLLIESYMKAQAVVSQNEQLDSQRS